jgi:MoaA/NifB/PqqE/SkfB family radical SAM enzyme
MSPGASPARSTGDDGVPFELALLYRGSLSSCNYACWYCPFAKRRDDRAARERDAAELARFVDWVATHRERRLGILFTPWGEALVRRGYRDAMVALSQMDHVVKVAAQTNLSCRLDWLAEARRERLALWCTYHPSQVARARFLGRCRELDALGIRYSVGMVGLRDDLEEIEALRRRLAPEVYLWVNAFKRDPAHYDAEQLARLAAIDPRFPLNNTRHPSEGRPCHAGHRAVTVDGAGTVRRCHFVSDVLGNLYEAPLDQILAPRPQPCPAATCGCHLGAVHLVELGQYAAYGAGLLERIPAGG